MHLAFFVSRSSLVFESVATVETSTGPLVVFAAHRPLKLSGRMMTARRWTPALLAAHALRNRRKAPFKLSLQPSTTAFSPCITRRDTTPGALESAIPGPSHRHGSTQLIVFLVNLDLGLRPIALTEPA